MYPKTWEKCSLLLPSHNCIIIHNVQFSRCIWISSVKRLNEASNFHLKFQSIPYLISSISYLEKWWARMDSLFCGKATPVATVHRTVAKCRLSSPISNSSAQPCAYPLPFPLKWWAKMDSNHRPHDYQSCALASWAIGPYQLHFFLWWRLAGSNRWPPACKAGALPAELNPHLLIFTCLFRYILLCTL